MLHESCNVLNGCSNNNYLSYLPFSFLIRFSFYSSLFFFLFFHSALLRLNITNLLNITKLNYIWWENNVANFENSKFLYSKFSQNWNLYITSILNLPIYRFVFLFIHRRGYDETDRKFIKFIRSRLKKFQKLFKLFRKGWK